MSDVTLSLVSHTNVGKTTLARTLLRRDVGTVLDAPHVTEVSEAHELIAVDGARLQLWDTPGFGDVGLWRVDPDEVATCFPEFGDRAEGCRFRGCSHEHEPDCARA